MDTLLAIKEVAAQQFGADPQAIDVNAPISQLGVDSLGFLEFLFELEDRLGISIPQEDVAKVGTLSELAAVIDGLKAAPKTASAG